MKFVAGNCCFVRSCNQRPRCKQRHKASTLAWPIARGNKTEYMKSGVKAASPNLVRCLENPNTGCLVCGYPNDECQDVKIGMLYYFTKQE